MLKIAANLELEPVAAAAQRFAWLGSSGSGKSYGCGRYVEQLAAANVPVIILDTVGIWPALRLAADGSGKGLGFVVIGGEHADVPLDLEAGAALARFLISTDASAIVDLSDHEPTPERARFIAEFANAVLVAVKLARRPRVIVFDEAQDLMPQLPGKGEEVMVRAVSSLVRKVRNHLCGIVLVTQRPQDVSKRAFDQVGNLFVGALFAKRARDAVRDWAGSKARSVEVDAQIDDLPALQPGEFFFWSPQWLQIYRRIRVLPKTTYDGSSTHPLAGVQLAKVAPVNVEALRALLTSKPVEPDAFRKMSNGKSVALGTVRELDWQTERDGLYSQIETLGKQLETLQGELRELREKWRRKLDGACATLNSSITDAQSTREQLGAILLALSAQSPSPSAGGEPVRNSRSKDGSRSSGGASPRENAAAKRGKDTRAPSPVADPHGSPSTNGDGLDSYTAELFGAIARYGPINRTKLALLAARNMTSGHFAKAIARLREQQRISDVGGSLAVIDGRALEAPEAPYIRGKDVLDAWRGQLTDYDRKVFDALAASRGGETRAWIAEHAGVAVSSGHFAKAVRRMKRLGLFDELDRKVGLSLEALWAMRL